ncbi:MAG: ECF-type sigma factor [Pirellulaceae bacterium]|nr:hypothetical protein [Planctomycetales bacterium]
MENGSITRWILSLKAGHPDAADALWDRYFERLAAIARRRLVHRVQAVDGEDVAVSVFDTIFRGVSAGRFPKLSDRTDLWKLLVAITHQKVCNQLRHERAQKRGGGNVKKISEINDLANPLSLIELDNREPTPLEIATLEDAFSHLLAVLPNDQMRRITLLKLEGFSNSEIAEMEQVTTRTVLRKLQVIEAAWLSKVE